MSILNAKLNQYFIWFPQDFFYPEIRERWTPIVKKLKLPYQSLEDYVNATVQSITFPEVQLTPVSQGQSQFDIKYRGGKELEPILDKSLNITFKLSEGFFTYWMFFEQIELFQRYSLDKPIFWPSMYVSFLDNNGFEILAFEFKKIIPIGLSQLNVSHATVAAEFNTFNLNLIYNRYNIKRKLDPGAYQTNEPLDI
jgi:hypothetical protein